MKTKFKSVVIVTWVAVAMVSCYDVLDQIPTDRFTDAVVWNDPFLLEQHLAQLYMFTPVMVGDAVANATIGWTGSPMNVDGNSQVDFLGFSALGEGSFRTLELSDEGQGQVGTQGSVWSTKTTGILLGGIPLRWWGNAYYTIRLLNNFIENGKNSPLHNIEIRIAEARFLRAFCYFAMVKRYGGVPLITEVQRIDADSTVLFPKRNTEKEVYDFILQETDEISKILPLSKEAGRANKWTALALRSRVALFAGSIAQFGNQQLNGLLGFPSGSHTQYYQICYDACHEIITQSPHSLYNSDTDKVQNFKNIFLMKGNSEAIMVKRHTGPGFPAGSNRWSWDMCQAPTPSIFGQGNNSRPYLETVEAFELIDGRPGTIDRAYAQSRLWTMEELWADRDPRFFASIWTNGTPWRKADGGVLGPNVVNMQNGIMSRDGELIDGRLDSYEGMLVVGSQLAFTREHNWPYTSFGVMKYLDPEADNMLGFGWSTTDYLIFRMGEILLNYAEAAFELGETADALSAVNDIRDRAGISQLTDIDREKIRHERRVELMFENHRYWDLRRWRIAVETLSRPGTGFTGLRYIYDAATGKYHLRFFERVDNPTLFPIFPERNYYWPIERRNTTVNRNLVENPGYE